MYELAGRVSKNKSETHMFELFHILIKIHNIIPNATLRPRERHHGHTALISSF